MRHDRQRRIQHQHRTTHDHRSPHRITESEYDPMRDSITTYYADPIAHPDAIHDPDFHTHSGDSQSFSHIHAYDHAIAHAHPDADADAKPDADAARCRDGNRHPDAISAEFDT